MIQFAETILELAIAMFMTLVFIVAFWFMAKITCGAVREAREEISKLRQEVKAINDRPAVDNLPEFGSEEEYLAFKTRESALINNRLFEEISREEFKRKFAYPAPVEGEVDESFIEKEYQAFKAKMMGI